MTLGDAGHDQGWDSDWAHHRYEFLIIEPRICIMIEPSHHGLKVECVWEYLVLGQHLCQTAFGDVVSFLSNDVLKGFKVVVPVGSFERQPRRLQFPLHCELLVEDPRQGVFNVVW